MSAVLKKCSFCNNEFDIKKCKDRICLEFKRDNELLRKYFCCRECFRDFIKKFQL